MARSPRRRTGSMCGNAARVSDPGGLRRSGSLVVLIATKLNRESRPELALQDRRFTILERMFEANAGRSVRCRWTCFQRSFYRCRNPCAGCGWSYGLPADAGRRKSFAGGNGERYAYTHTNLYISGNLRGALESGGVGGRGGEGGRCGGQ